MANESHLSVLKQGVKAWNRWREQDSSVNPQLGEANLDRADLRRANLRDANLRDANLSKADLSEADLRDANLFGADLRGLRDARQRDQVSPRCGFPRLGN
jgi:uncharacterized protein YjbI with pentapeptide repeats